MIKKLVYLGLSLVFAVACFSAILFSTPNKVYAEAVGSLDGNGTINNPYTITSSAELKNFSTLVNGGKTFDGEYVVLTQDIEFSGTDNFTPIGYTKTNYFKGNFDGQGHTIKNLKINSTFSFIGLFGYIKAVDEVVIENIVIDNFQADSTNNFVNVYAGAILGYCDLGITSTSGTLNHNTSTIQNIAVLSGEIDLKSNSYACYAGGIVGATSLSWNGTSINENQPFTDILNIYFSWSNIDISVDSNELYNEAKAGILGLGFACIENCYCINNSLRSQITPSSNTGLFHVRYCYQKINQNFENYVIYTAYGANNDSGARDKTSAEEAKTSIANSYNDYASKWVIIDTAFYGATLVLKNVGYIPPESTSANITVVERCINIPNSTTSISYSTIGSSSTITLTKGQSFSPTEKTNYTQDNLSKFDVPFMVFSNGTSTLAVNNLPLTITSEHIEFAESGYTLYINYTDAKLIKVNGKEYWIIPNNNNLYTFSNGKFTQATTSDSGLVLPDNDGKCFLGWATNQPSGICDLNSDGTNWYTEGINFAIRILRANMPTNSNVTGISVIDYANIPNNATFNEVWGDFSFRMYANVYSFVDGTYKKLSNIQISTTTTKTSSGYKIAKNTAYTLTLKNSKGNTIQVGTNLGYISVEWFVGEIFNNEKSFSNYSTSTCGTFSNTNTVSTTFTSTTRETSVVAVIVPKTNIAIAVSTNEFEGSDEVVKKLNNNIITETTTLVYGETYTISLENLPNLWFIKTITSTPITSFDKNGATCTFTVDFTTDMQVHLEVEESLLSNAIMYSFIALLIIAGATILLTLIINTFKPSGIPPVAKKQ